MADNSDLYTIQWLGYNEKPNYDRIWGYMTMKDGRLCAFWGPRNKGLQFKYHRYQESLLFLTNQQESKGYKKIDIDQYESICPNFRQDLELWCTATILADVFR